MAIQPSKVYQSTMEDPVIVLPKKSGNENYLQCEYLCLQFRIPLTLKSPPTKLQADFSQNNVEI